MPHPRIGAGRRLGPQFAEPGPEKFDDYPDEPGPFGAPLLPFGVALLVCAHHAALDGGDHTILIGRVVYTGPRGHRPAGLLQPGLLADQRDHLIVQPTGAVSARLGEPPSSTASRASRR